MRIWLAVLVLAQDKIEADIAKANKEISDDHVKLGEYLEGAKMFRLARGEYQRALGLDPGNEKAKKKISSNLPAEDQRKEKEAEKIRGEHAARLDKIKDRAVKLFLELGKSAKRAGLADPAAACFRRVLEYDGANKAAREEMGYTYENERWVSPAEKALRAEFRDGVAGQPAGEASDAESEFEKKAKVKTAKRASKAMFVESAHLSQDQMAKASQMGAQAIAMYQKLFGIDKPLLDKPIHMILLKTRAEHTEYCKFYDPGSTAERAVVLKQEGTMYDEPPMAECIQLDRGERFSFDYTIHATTHILNSLHVGEGRAWLREGLGYYFTWMMRGTALCFCINLEGTSQEGGKAYAEPGNWPSIIKQLVLAGKDADMKRILVTEMNDMDTPKLIKAFSLVDFLVSEHRDKLPALGQALRDDQKDKGPKAIEKVFGWTAEELDTRWKDFVRRTY